MKKLLFLFVGLLLTFGCTNPFDDTAINDRLDSLEERVAALEELCNQMNTNISSLQTIVAALQNNDYITSVTPITENGVEIGYTITFAKSNPITIYHGKDGHTPVVGVRQDTDGIYYWTLDGEWLLDDDGNKIKAVGTDGEDGKDGEDGANGTDGSNGEDGITPQLKIEDGYWFVSYDNGTTWTKLGKATGENGKDGIDGIDGADGQDGTNGKDGDSMFKEIKQDENNVYFVLVDGTEIIVPKQKELSITFSDSDIGIIAGKSTTVDYVITGATDKTVVKAFGQGGWYAKVTPATNSTGTITVTAPDPLIEDEIIVLVNDGEYRSIITSINFVTGVFSSIISAQEVAIEGGTVELKVNTNMQYEVVIPDNAKSWLSVVETKAMREETITLSCAKNEGLQRTATIKLLDEYGKEFSSYAIFQWGISADVTDMSTAGTANSYIVSNAGYYKFKTVKGNSNESIGTVAYADVLWETFGTDVTPNVGDLISDISYSNDYITFRTGITYKEGNALVAAKDENGTILWSWHIWFTDKPKDHVYNNNAGTMMDRNLGATAATPGDVGALGLLYQWGRKDPFLGSSSISSSVQAQSTMETWPTPVSSDASNGTIEYATSNPTTFITYNDNNYDWYYTGTEDTDNTRWQSSKGMYDPCPVGYRVPDGGENGIWSTAFGSSAYFNEDAYDDINKGFDFGTSETYRHLTDEETCWYPYAGCLTRGGSGLFNVGYGGAYWSCTPDLDNADCLGLADNGFVYPSIDSMRATGYSVRCLQE